MLREPLLLIPLAFAPVLLPVTGCLDPDEPGNLVPKTVVEDSTLPRIEVAGALMHAEAFGLTAAPTVIVLHGGPGSDYRNLLDLRALADDGYRVQFWDQRGCGLSQRFDADHYTTPGYLEDLLSRRTKIRDDHSLIGETQIFQLFPHHGALRAPFDMIQR